MLNIQIGQICKKVPWFMSYSLQHSGLSTRREGAAEEEREVIHHQLECLAKDTL